MEKTEIQQFYIYGMLDRRQIVAGNLIKPKRAPLYCVPKVVFTILRNRHLSITY